MLPKVFKILTVRSLFFSNIKEIIVEFNNINGSASSIALRLIKSFLSLANKSLSINYSIK